MRRSQRDKPQIVTDAFLRRWALPRPAEEGSKEARGRALIIAGATEMPGAAILASNAALRAGAGKVRVATAEAAALFVASAVPELFVLGIEEGKRRVESLRAVIDSATTAGAVLIGSGMRDVDAVQSLLPRLLKIESIRALVIDATALRVAAKLLPDEPTLRGKIIITPHKREMASLAGISPEKVEADPVGVASKTARTLGCIVVLKGAETLICARDGSAYSNQRGNAGLATAGSGDVLAGILTGLCARGVEPLQAAMWAVALHARAGETLAKRIGPIGFLARELADEVPPLMSRLAEGAR